MFPKSAKSDKRSLEGWHGVMVRVSDYTLAEAESMKKGRRGQGAL